VDIITEFEASNDAAAVSSLPPANKASRERLQALERGLEALSLLNRFGAGTSTQVAKALGLKRSTAHRILGVLVKLGLLRHDAFNHQYILCERVSELSSGYHDDPWVTACAVPLILTTPLAGRLVVRASTDYESPMSVDRFHGGQVIPVEGSTAGMLYLAFAGESPPPLILRRKGPRDELEWAAPEELARIRASGYVARPTACFTGARISVPLSLERPFIGCITMRCRAENIELISEVDAWVASLRRVARLIGTELKKNPPPAD
jgi:DNA-binding IclR family transcriptional regulator